MTFELHVLGRVRRGSSPDASPARRLPDVPGLVRDDGLVDYRASLELQAALRDEVVAGVRGPSLLALEHPPVYTAGRRTTPDEHPYDGTEVVEIDRGGKLTWHGPGQLVVYLVGALAEPLDAPALVRDLESAIVATLRGAGLPVETVEGRSGAWLPADRFGPARKVAAIGLAIRQGVTTHGIAVNCTNDLRPFGRIVPCGITDAGVASLESEGVRGTGPAELAPPLLDALRATVGRRYAPAAARASTVLAGAGA